MADISKKICAKFYASVVTKQMVPEKSEYWCEK